MDHSPALPPALPPDHQRCSICIEAKNPSEMSDQVSPRCKHQSTVCKDCIEDWLQSSIERGAWDRLKCPDCSEQLGWQDVKRHASEETFTRYDSLVLRAALSKDPTFQFCLSSTCGSGQMYEVKCPRFECVACAASFCLKHNVLWHSGETCEEYDERAYRGRREAEQASERAVRELSKPCPKCKRDVHKYEGCNHITCICGHDWCYICAGAWQRTRSGVPMYCKHEPGCTESDAFQNAFNELNPGLALQDFLPPLVAADEQPEAVWEVIARLVAEHMRGRVEALRARFEALRDRGV